jgi:Fe2+ or Zn2+ uptake regulation protein
MQDLAQRYEGLLRRRGMRADVLRMQVLEIMAGEEEFFDVKKLLRTLEETGVKADPEKCRYVVKRLNDAGLLERRRVEDKNKYEFRLRDLENLMKEYSDEK